MIQSHSPDLRCRVAALKPARDELRRLMIEYRVASPEHRRLAEACLALDAVAGALVGDVEVLAPPARRRLVLTAP